MAVRRWTVGYLSQSHVVTTNLSLSLSVLRSHSHTPVPARRDLAYVYCNTAFARVLSTVLVLKLGTHMYPSSISREPEQL